MLPPSTLLKDGRIKQRKQGWASSWTDPPRPRPPRWVFWPHKASYKVRSHTHAFAVKFFQVSPQGEMGNCGVRHGRDCNS